VSLAPFPHNKEQTDGEAEVQEYPAAAPEHPVKHPTPLFDPSSQISDPFMSPSPQTVVQTDGKGALQL